MSWHKAVQGECTYIEDGIRVPWYGDRNMNMTGYTKSASWLYLCRSPRSRVSSKYLLCWSWCNGHQFVVWMSDVSLSCVDGKLENILSYPGRSSPGITFSAEWCGTEYLATRNVWSFPAMPLRWFRLNSCVVVRGWKNFLPCLTEGGGIVFVTVIRPSTLPSGCKPGHSQLTVYAKYTGAMAS